MSVPAQKCGILEKTPVGRGAVKSMKHVPFLGKLIIMGVIPLAVLGIAVGILSFRQAALVVRQSQKRVISDTINRIDININVKARQFDGFLTAVSESPETALLLQAAGAGTADRFDSRALQHFCRTTLGSFARAWSSISAAVRCFRVVHRRLPACARSMTRPGAAAAQPCGWTPMCTEAKKP